MVYLNSFPGRFYTYPLQVFKWRIVGSGLEPADEVAFAHIGQAGYFVYTDIVPVV